MQCWLLTFVRRLIKVDLPHPESAATPITTTFSSTPSFIAREYFPLKEGAKGAKPIALAIATKRIKVRNMAMR